MWRSRVSQWLTAERPASRLPRSATRGLADAPRTPAISKEPEESGPMILIAMPPRDPIDR